MAAEGQIPKKEGLRMWRTDEHNGAFMKGGRGKCCGRVCLCSLVLVLVILISVITAFLRKLEPFFLFIIIYRDVFFSVTNDFYFYFLFYSLDKTTRCYF